MARYKRFTFLCDANERRVIAELAKRLHRSQSDAVRFVIFEAIKDLNIQVGNLEDVMPNKESGMQGGSNVSAE